MVDTPAYQRLRWIKQLGPANLVYPGANHTRHEHCMGTNHVVGKMADSVGLNSEEKQLASVAGLLHDLGHTAFHIWEMRLEEWTIMFFEQLN